MLLLLYFPPVKYLSERQRHVKLFARTENAILTRFIQDIDLGHFDPAMTVCERIHTYVLHMCGKWAAAAIEIIAFNTGDARRIRRSLGKWHMQMYFASLIIYVMHHLSLFHIRYTTRTSNASHTHGCTLVYMTPITHFSNDFQVHLESPLLLSPSSTIISSIADYLRRRLERVCSKRDSHSSIHQFILVVYRMLNEMLHGGAEVGNPIETACTYWQ